MKAWKIIGSAVAVGVAIGGGILVVRTIQQPTIPAQTAEKPTPTPEVAMKQWADPAGFSLSYPETLAMNKHDEDEVNYAHLEFTDPAHPGTLIVWAKDIPAGVTDVETWVKKEKSFAAANVIDTTFGGEDAKKVVLSSPSKKIVVGTLYDDVLWYAEVAATDEQYWTSVFENLTSSFSFKAAASGTDADQSSGDTGVAADEEEVLE